MVAKVTVGSRQRRLATPPGLPADHVAGCPLDLLLAPNPADQHNLLPVPDPASCLLSPAPHFVTRTPPLPPVPAPHFVTRTPPLPPVPAPHFVTRTPPLPLVLSLSLFPAPDPVPAPLPPKKPGICHKPVQKPVQNYVEIIKLCRFWLLSLGI
jgi:hypothetical protein